MKNQIIVAVNLKEHYTLHHRLIDLNLQLWQASGTGSLMVACICRQCFLFILNNKHVDVAEISHWAPSSVAEELKMQVDVGVGLENFLFTTELGLENEFWKLETSIPGQEIIASLLLISSPVKPRRCITVCQCYGTVNLLLIALLNLSLPVWTGAGSHVGVTDQSSSLLFHRVATHIPAACWESFCFPLLQARCAHAYNVSQITAPIKMPSARSSCDRCNVAGV